MPKAKRPNAPPIRRRGERIDYTTYELGAGTGRGDRVVDCCPACQKNGEKSIWKGGEVFFIHRGMLLDGQFRMTESCYIGIGEWKNDQQGQLREGSGDSDRATSTDNLPVTDSGEAKPKRRGRPPGSKNKPKTGKPRGRPKGSKNKPKGD